MEKFLVHSGVAAPLRRSTVDTDQIIAAPFLKKITRTGFEDGLFASWREHPEFVLNDPRYAGASILVAGRDFGTGSSREHAVWALQDYGFRVVISPRFGDIFRSNSAKSGLLTAQLEQEGVEALWDVLEREPGSRLTVDLESQVVRTATGAEMSFDIDGYTRERLLAGLDDIDVTLTHEDAIARFEAQRPSFAPRVTPPTDPN